MARHRIHQGFTLIELMVVVGIITVLVGILFVGLKFVGGSQKINSTRVTLGNLKGMLAELEVANGLKSQPAAWLWWNGGMTNSTTAAYSVDFWKLPYRVNNNSANNVDPLVAPGDVGDSAGFPLNQRNASIAVVNTMLAMSMISALPANRSRLDSLPQDTKFLPQWVTGPVPSAGADGFLGTTDDGPPQPLGYAPSVHVKHDGKLFVANLTAGTNPSAPVAGATSGAWIDETATPNSTPLLLDAWGNPIIFVPASGLRVLMLNGKTRYGFQESPAVNFPEQRFIIVSPEGQVLNNGSAALAPTVSRVGRPFWASAGPDGDFSKGDDNVYSFEQ